MGKECKGDAKVISSEMKVALVYDRVNKWGGAERVLLALHEMFPEAPLYTSVYNSKTAKWAKIFPEIHTSFLQKLSFVRTRHEWVPFLMPLAFESFDFAKYDLVISVTSEFAKSIITRPGTRHICYCLTPTRYLWSGHDEYFSNKLFKFLAKQVVNYLRRVDKIVAARPDEMIAISSEVKRRIKKYYKRDVKVIFPPVSIKIPKQKPIYNIQHTTYFLLVSRLVPYKKADLAVRAFNENGHKLVIVGTGADEQRLKAMAGKNIKFAGHATEKELAKYYKNCTALVFPQREDFGLVAVEAMAYGKPVIAFRGGGVLDIIKENINGIFFDEQTAESLNAAIKTLFTKKWSSAIISSTAKRFSKERFKNLFLKEAVV